MASPSVLRRKADTGKSTDSQEEESFTSSQLLSVFSSRPDADEAKALIFKIYTPSEREDRSHSTRLPGEKLSPFTRLPSFSRTHSRRTFSGRKDLSARLKTRLSSTEDGISAMSLIFATTLTMVLNSRVCPLAGQRRTVTGSPLFQALPPSVLKENTKLPSSATSVSPSCPAALQRNSAFPGT